MVELLQGGAYLVNGREIIADEPQAQQAVLHKTGKSITKEEAKKQTIFLQNPREPQYLRRYGQA